MKMCFANIIFSGPYKLTSDNIDRYIDDESLGVYILGRTWGGQFKPRYVGRSDSNLNERLKDHINEYPEFCYRVLDSVNATFEHECKLYHILGEDYQLDNEIHPRSPDSQDLECPCKSYHKTPKVAKLLEKLG